MAVSTATPQNVDDRSTYLDGAIFHAYGTLSVAPSPATYQTGGIPCNLNISLIKAQRSPVRVDITGNAGYEYRYVKGADNSSGLLQIFQGAGAALPMSELVNAVAIPPTIPTDTIAFHGMWLGQL